MLSGKVAVVTGAGQGLGRAEALELAAQGASVVVNDIGESADAVVAEIVAAGGAAVAHAGNVADWDISKAIIDRAINEFGSLDILVNNAGFTRDRTIFNMTEEEFDSVVNVHLKGHFCMSRHATAYWRERSKAAGGPIYARLVNTTSESWINGSAGQPNYGPAKAGIATMTLSIHNSCWKYGVRANAIAPRARTAMTEKQSWPHTQDQEFDRFAPEHVAKLVAVLAGPAAERIMGQVFMVWGGLVQLLHQVTVEHRFENPTGWSAEALAAAFDEFFAERDPQDNFNFPT